MMPRSHRPRRRGPLALLLLAGVVAGAPWVGHAIAAGLFPDPNLEAAVREQVFRKRGTDLPLTRDDVGNVSVVHAARRGITRLDGLEHCRALAMLDLAGNRITDLSPLAGLDRLQYLDVQSNRVSTLRPLASVSALQYLHLGGNEVSDAGPLAGLTNLAALYLSGNRVETVQPLRDLRRLTSLYLDGNRIQSVDALGALAGLTTLSLSDNRLADVEALTRLKRLRHLFLDRNRIQDLAPLVAWVQADREQHFAPFLQLSLDGNPLSSEARRRQVKALREGGVTVTRQPTVHDGAGSGDPGLPSFGPRRGVGRPRVRTRRTTAFGNGRLGGGPVGG